MVKRLVINKIIIFQTENKSIKTFFLNCLFHKKKTKATILYRYEYKVLLRHTTYTKKILNKFIVK